MSNCKLLTISQVLNGRLTLAQKTAAQPSRGLGGMITGLPCKVLVYIRIYYTLPPNPQTTPA